MERPLSVTLSALIYEDKILLIKRIKGNFPGLWGLPGGKIESNEHIQSSAVREILEESGIESEFKSHLGVVSEHIIEKDDLQHIILHICELKPLSFELKQGIEGELKWFDLDSLDLHKEEIIASDLMMIEHLVKKKDSLYYNSVLEKIEGKYFLKKFESLEKKQEKIIIDIGSYTVKVYLCTKDKTSSLFQKSIRLKENFSPDFGISDNVKRELFNIINSIKTRYDNEIKIYSTAVFRDMQENMKKDFEKEFYNTTGLNLNIIDQDKESYYLQLALIGRCSIQEPILLMNTGGGSTQVILVKEKKPLEKINIQIGVGTINTLFPSIKEQISNINIDDIVNYVKKNVPEISTKAKLAFNTGGELSFMRLTKYPITQNTLFQDVDHPSLIPIEAFGKKNIDIFHSVSLSELESLMPENPSWMHGTRAYLAISQAICEKYGVETIIPSDSNIIHGIVRSEFS
ncbi:MAG: NUDIX domain-containing protein [Candidatus Aenigmarchaeota archaeon]|nr:NUDIX domain-containing protein [Candidatus Aenigmarchaeota archaeon]